MNSFIDRNLKYFIIADGEVEVRASSRDIKIADVPPIVEHEGEYYAVTRIDRHAFMECNQLKSISIPDSVTEIRDFAFSYCTSLKSIELPDSITEIGRYAFYGCRVLESINIPEHVTKIRKSTFELCDNLSSVTIPESVTSIGCWAFRKCVGLTSVTIPESVTLIDEGAFEDCYFMLSITFDGLLPHIKRWAFYGIHEDCVINGLSDGEFNTFKEHMSIKLKRGTTKEEQAEGGGRGAEVRSDSEGSLSDKEDYEGEE